MALPIVSAVLVLAACGGQPYDPNKQDEAHRMLSEGTLPDSVIGSGKTEGQFYPTYAADGFKGMDEHVSRVYGHDFSRDEIRGRNTWVMWTGGNQEFWDAMSNHSLGIVDFLKILDNRFVKRSDRFRYFGVVPNPGLKERVAEPGPKSEWTKYPYYGLSLDEGIVKGGYAEGAPVPNPAVYGYSSGIVGLRLFPRETDPDPKIRAQWEKAKGDWDPVRFLTDEDYYTDPDLVRPYRVGMACSFCHVQANPMNPPPTFADSDGTQVKWEHLSSNIGQQYFYFGRIFGPTFTKDNVVWHLTNYPEPGSLDTSLVATDGNNNPNTMNGVFQLLPRVIASLRSPMEKQEADTLAWMPRLDQAARVDVKGDKFEVLDYAPGQSYDVNDIKPVMFDPESELPFIGWLLEGVKLPGDLKVGTTPDGHALLPTLGTATSRHTPKILAGGADSIGGRGALCRVYLNIGEFSSEWRQIQNTMIGITPQRPFKMEQCFKRSVNWAVTMRRSTNVAKYFLATSVPMRLNAAKGVEALPEDLKPKPNNDPLVVRGAEVFARDCFVCHSSVQPEQFEDEFWKAPNDWKKWSQNPDYIKAATELIVEHLNNEGSTDPRKDDFFNKFLKPNYLSTDARYRVEDIGTNTARSLADNAGTNQRMWADYSSQDFKAQDRSGATIDIADPYDPNKTRKWKLNTEAGFGRYRPHSLSSMWAHAPYLHNNSVGFYPFEPMADPRPGRKSAEQVPAFAEGIQSVKTRVEMFEGASRRLLGLPGNEDARYFNEILTKAGFKPDQARRLYASIRRTESDLVDGKRAGYTSIHVPKEVIADVIYLQTMALFGFGITKAVLITLLVLLILFGVFLFVKGFKRLREGKGKWVKNGLLVVIGLVVALGIYMLWRSPPSHLGRIPDGTPVNLVASINGPDWVLESSERKRLTIKAILGLKKARKSEAKSLEEIEVFGEPLVDILIRLSKCPDLIVDKGHEFGMYQTPGMAAGQKVAPAVTEINGKQVDDREALIEFLKLL